MPVPDDRKSVYDFDLQFHYANVDKIVYSCNFYNSTSRTKDNKVYTENKCNVTGI